LFKERFRSFPERSLVPLFRPAVRIADHSPDNPTAVPAFNLQVLPEFYVSVSLSLVTRHKLLTSTFFAVRTLAAEKPVPPATSVARQRSTAAGPAPSWVPADAWKRVAAISDAAPPIALVLDYLRVNRAPWAARIAAGELEVAELLALTLGPITAFLKLMLVPTLHRHNPRDNPWCSVEETLSPEAVASPSFNLLNALGTAEPIALLIFI
jgi:hypothetical protein